ncbi:MAG: hypothetical protein QNJ75_08635 [Acidimicrobiia bacterium]|nr:hypothetical protein [Acidimicrobiia bacterium]
MSEIAIFGFGAVIFMITTWATFSFGLRRMGEIQAKELERANLTAIPRKSGLTEIHVDRKVARKRGSAS